MKIALIGSSGFIGQHLVRSLVMQGYSVLGIDKQLTTWQHPTFVAAVIDILDLVSLREAITSFSPDYIFHLAARTDLDEKNDISGYAANIDGVDNLIRVIRVTPSVKRCVLTSSQLVCRIGYVPKHEQDYCPSTLYGQSKVLTEEIVRKQDGAGVEWCLVRPTTVWGPGMNSHYQQFFRMIERGVYFHIGHKGLYKSYSYVGNIVHQYMKLLEVPAEQIHRKMLYLADYQPLSLRQWADELQCEMGAKPIRSCPEGLARVAAKLGDFLNLVGFKKFPLNSFRLNNVLTEYQFDLSQTQDICGPLPYTVEQGVTETVTWLKNNKIIG